MQYQYKVHRADVADAEQVLNTLGKEGWLLVAIRSAGQYEVNLYMARENP